MKNLGIITALLSLILISACEKPTASATPAPTAATALPASPTAAPTPLTLTDTPRPPTPITATDNLAPSSMATSEPLNLPAFIPGDCRFRVPSGDTECGDLIVPEDRAHPDGRTGACTSPSSAVQIQIPPRTR